MTLGEILKTVVEKDLSAVKKNTLTYIEKTHEGQFIIKLSSIEDREAYIECKLPTIGTEDERNYLRSYFLSMAFHAAVYGMKRQKSKKFK